MAGIRYCFRYAHIKCIFLFTFFHLKTKIFYKVDLIKFEDESDYIQ